jgi:FixJ family two-component response regulator
MISSASSSSASHAGTASSPRPVVYIVDDDSSVRDALAHLVHGEGWRAESFACASTFLASTRPLVPSCLVLDISLSEPDGLDVQRRLAGHIPIIIISYYSDVPTTVRAMKAGAVEFLLKPLADEAVLAGIQYAIQRSRATLCVELELQDLRASHALLSRRERQVMALVTAGLLNKQVGAELGISELTVKAHRGQVMRKMHVTSLADLVRMASKLGI